MDNAITLITQLRQELGGTFESRLDFLETVLKMPSWEQNMPDFYDEDCISSPRTEASALTTTTDYYVAALSQFSRYEETEGGSATQASPRSVPSHAGSLSGRQRKLNLKAAVHLVMGAIKMKQLSLTYPDTVKGEIKEALDKEFALLDTRDFNVLNVSKLTNGRPLTFTLWRCLQAHNLITRMQIPLQNLKNFLGSLERRYNNVAYHNSEHAADVVHVVHYIIVSGLKETLTPLEIFSMLIAAGAHDVEHNGVNNAFHVKLMTPVAIMHNDQSVLENHHCTVAWTLVQHRKTNIISGLSPTEQREFRTMMVQIILGTDMTLHVELFSDFKRLVDGGTPVCPRCSMFHVFCSCHAHRVPR